MQHLRALRTRLSQRGACLLLIAVLDFIYAIGLAGADQATRANPTYRFLDGLIPLNAWAGVWAAVGGLCLVQAWVRWDWLAYTAATGLKIAWALLHLGAWAFGVMPRGYVSAAVWLLAAGFVMVVSTVPKGAHRRDS